MKKIKYRIVYNRKKRLDSQGKALVQVEAYLLGKKAYFSTHIYIKPDQWNSRKSIICNHPHAEELNYMLEEFILNLQMRLEVYLESCCVSHIIKEIYLLLTFVLMTGRCI